jgi:protoporphyrinogen oxidase
VKIAVIGAGLSGLTAAWRLQQAGHTVSVFEAQSHPGGRVWSTTAGGFEIDVGAHMLLDCYDRTRALVDEMGLSDGWFPLESAEEGGVLRGDRLTSFSPRDAFDVLRYRGLPLAGRIRLFVALAAARRFRDDLDFFDLSVGDDKLDNTDCRTFALDRMGEEATEYVVDTFIRTFHFHGAHRMSRKYFEALAVLLITRGPFQPCALRGYMRALPEALATRLSMTYDAPVRTVTPGPDGVRVTLPTSERTFDRVVVATTAETARRLLPGGTGPRAELLAHAMSSCTATCSIALPVAIAGGFEGIWVPFVESQIISGLSNETSKGSTDGTHCVFTVWLHEEAASSLLSASDEDIFATLRGELERLFPRYAGHITPLHIQRWPEALPVYGPGQISRVREFWDGGQGEAGIWLCGDYLDHPWVEGAVRCGERVAAGIDVTPGFSPVVAVPRRTSPDTAS